MKINARLKKIGDLVEANSFCLDVGCDHALLDIYLVSRKMNIKNINGLNFLYKSHINKTPIRLFLSKEIKKDDDLKKKSLCNSTSVKYILNYYFRNIFYFN